MQTPVWSQSDRFVPRRVVRPVQSFMHNEAAGGIVMLIAAVVALVWANSPLSESYVDLWHTRLDIVVGDLIHLELTLEQWVNDGAMVIFFFVVGMEIKRELVIGELREPKAAALPAIAALGGMVVPAAVYLAFNAGEPTSDGWGIPMATDIAFAVGIVALVGNRVPTAAKLFLLALAIVDDLGAIAVIAVFYTDSLAMGWLGAALVAFVAAYVLRRAHVRSLAPYLALGVFAWLAVHESGVHATIAGVVMGLLTPVRSFYEPARFKESAMPLLEKIDAGYHDNEYGAEHESSDHYVFELQRLASETVSPLDRLEHKLHLWASFVIIPVFALANAGVEVTGDMLSGAFGEPVVIGIILGLVAGKTLGISLFTWIAVKTGLGRLPNRTTWRHVFGLSMAGGIGFTVALFVANLSFPAPGADAHGGGHALGGDAAAVVLGAAEDGDDHGGGEGEVVLAEGEVPPLDYAKVGILVGSLIAGVGSYLFLRTSPPLREDESLEV